MFHVALLLIGLVAKSAARRVSIGRITDDVVDRRQGKCLIWQKLLKYV